MGKSLSGVEKGADKGGQRALTGEPLSTSSDTARGELAGRRPSARGRYALAGVPLKLLVAVALGYGSYLAIFPFGPLGTTLLVGAISSQPLSLLARALTFVCIVAAMFAQRLPVAGWMRSRAFLGVSYALVAAAVLGLALSPGLLEPFGFAAQLMALAPCVVLFGLGMGMPELAWYQTLQTVHAFGSFKGLSVAVLFMAAVTVAWVPASLLAARGAPAAIASCLLCLAVSLACVILAGRLGAQTHPSDPLAMDARELHVAGPRWVPTVLYGAVWAICCCLAVRSGFGQEGGWWATMGAFAGGAAVCAAIGLGLVRNDARVLAYGSVLRFVLLASGVAFALLPLFVPRAPFAVAFCCFVVYQVLNIINPHYVTVYLASSHIPVHQGLPAAYGAFALGALAGTVCLVVLFALLPLQLASTLAIAAGTILLFAQVPLLPMRQSNVGETLLGGCSRDESRDKRVARAVEIVKAGYKLTGREVDILKLILDYRSREEIAAQLGISASTVKNHTSRLYAKLGVHSVHEVETLLRDGGLL